ncbi:MAG: glycosyltransferase, partial [Candidatus Omnitrophota bacterium]
KLLVAASTHQGEEAIILSVYKAVLADFPRLRLLIAPRHPERAKDIEKFALEQGCGCRFISSLASHPLRTDNNMILILDTIGELVNFYQISNIVFVGGSFVKKGGHNIIEPASCAKPVIFGPYMFNFRDIAELFIANDAAIKVRKKDELYAAIKELLMDNVQADSLGRKARSLVEQNQKATQRNIEILKEII